MPEGQRVVVVSGGASGMGAACARLFSARGDTVAILDIAAAEPAPALAATRIRVDIRDSARCDAAIAEVVERHGRVDALVNAAGVITRAAAPDTSDADWHAQFAVNVDGTFFLSRAAVRAMGTTGGGAIVNFASIWGLVGGRRHVAYCAAKGAVVQLTRAMALDHAREGIRVNAVCPGEVDTPMLRAGGRAKPLGDAELAALAEATIPMGRVARPDEIAQVVVFLASPQASYMTGSIVSVDAGITAA